MQIAILIDAENVDPAYADQIFSYANSIGTITVKEIYGAGIALNEWANPILHYAIHMNLTLKPNRYKNSSDIALVIGAMDLLAEQAAALKEKQVASEAAAPEAPEAERHSEERKVETIIIASSDSDFSALAIRLRTAGMQVIGMGNAEKINASWPIACSDFVPFATTAEAAYQPQLPPQRWEKASLKETLPSPVHPRTMGREEQPLKKEGQPLPLQAQKKKLEKSPPQPDPNGQVAPTHTARVDIIRAFIAAQIAASGGRVHTTTILRLLHDLPDYRFDQQRSKRKPLEYLIRQYGDSFQFIKEADGYYWAYPLPAAEKSEAVQGVEVSGAEAQPQEAGELKHETEVPPQEAGDASWQADGKPLPGETEGLPQEAGETPWQADGEPLSEENGELPRADGHEQLVMEDVRSGALGDGTDRFTEIADPAADPTPDPSSLAAFLSSSVPEETARQIAAICEESPNYRIVYNELRKQFGSTDGRRYLQLVKEYSVAYASQV